jgi:hypothetical protein
MAVLNTSDGLQHIDHHGGVLETANRSDPRNAECQQLLPSTTGPLAVPALVIAEAGFLIVNAGT